MSNKISLESERFPFTRLRSLYLVCSRSNYRNVLCKYPSWIGIYWVTHFDYYNVIFGTGLKFWHFFQIIHFCDWNLKLRPWHWQNYQIVAHSSHQFHPKIHFGVFLKRGGGWFYLPFAAHVTACHITMLSMSCADCSLVEYHKKQSSAYQMFMRIEETNTDPHLENFTRGWITLKINDRRQKTLKVLDCKWCKLD